MRARRCPGSGQRQRFFEPTRWDQQGACRPAGMPVAAFGNDALALRNAGASELARARAAAYVTAGAMPDHARPATPRTNAQRARGRGGAVGGAWAHSRLPRARAHGGADDRGAPALCLHSRALRRQRAARRGLAGRLRRRRLDLRHLCVDPRRHQPPGLQRRVASGLRLARRAKIRSGAIHVFHGGDRRRRRRRAPHDPLGRGACR